MSAFLSVDQSNCRISQTLPLRISLRISDRFTPGTCQRDWRLLSYLNNQISQIEMRTHTYTHTHKHTHTHTQTNTHTHTHTHTQTHTHTHKHTHKHTHAHMQTLWTPFSYFFFSFFKFSFKGRLILTPTLKEKNF